jgi:hypothetical protein
MSNMRKKPAWKCVENVIFFSLLIYFYCSNLKSITFYPDESQWIATSSVFEAFVNGNFKSPLFKESYWTITQPPLPRYIIGLGRTMGGFGISDLNVPWDFWKDFKTNIDEGRMPSNQLLWWSRLPMAILAAMSIFAVLCLIKIMAGRGPAYIWVGLSLISSYFLFTLGRAMGESPLLASIVLIMLITNKLLQVSDNELKKTWLLYLYIVYLGVGIGLAESSKLNGISALAAGFLLSIIILFRKFQSRTLKIRFGLITILILIFTSQFTFFLINPYLWPDPLNREKTMFYHRVYEMINQKVKNPSVIIEGVVDHIEVDTTRIFQSYAAIHFNGFIFLNIFFFLIGISYILVKSFQYLKHRQDNPAWIAILIVGACSSFPPLFTPLDWDRYYLLPVFFSTIFIAIGIWLSILFVYTLILKMHVRQASSIG